MCHIRSTASCLNRFRYLPSTSTGKSIEPFWSLRLEADVLSFWIWGSGVRGQGSGCWGQGSGCTGQGARIAAVERKVNNFLGIHDFYHEDEKAQTRIWLQLCHFVPTRSAAATQGCQRVLLRTEIFLHVSLLKGYLLEWIRHEVCQCYPRKNIATPRVKEDAPTISIGTGLLHSVRSPVRRLISYEYLI